jgi:hypothetical protein
MRRVVGVVKHGSVVQLGQRFGIGDLVGIQLGSGSGLAGEGALEHDRLEGRRAHGLR